MLLIHQSPAFPVLLNIMQLKQLLVFHKKVRLDAYPRHSLYLRRLASRPVRGTVLLNHGGQRSFGVVTEFCDWTVI